MFGFLVTLLTIALFPVALLMGKPTRVRLLHGALPLHMQAHFPVAGFTTIIVHIQPYAWVTRIAQRHQVAAFAWLGFIVLCEEGYTEVISHEAVHVLQQALMSPPLFLLYWGLSALLYAPFARYYKSGTGIRVFLHEYIAYTLDEDGRNDSVLTNRRKHGT